MLDPLLRRLGYDSAVRVDVGTLRALHRTWRTRVPYENLDIQLGRPIALDAPALFDKLVHRRRGGYCYEQNGGLALLLRAAGFEVTIIEAAVQRAARGDAMWGNHNLLLVDLDGERWIADAGIGDGFLHPLPLRAGRHEQGRFTYRLEQLDSGTWRFHHDPGGTIASYDFRLRPRDLTEFAGRSHELSTSPDSPYVTTLILARPAPEGTLLLLSRTLRWLGAPGSEVSTIAGVEEFADILSERFLVPLDDLGPEGVGRLWEKAGAQHDLWRAQVH